MKRSIRIKLIQLLILIAFWISLIILFGGEEPATGEPIEVVEYNYIPDILPDLPEAPEPIIILARVTAYAPFDNKSGICNDGDPSNTSTGKFPGPEYAAADPARLPYGTRLEIPGYGTVEVQDTGGALRSYEGIAIDVYFDTYDEAMEWGVQYLEVEVLEVRK